MKKKKGNSEMKKAAARVTKKKKSPDYVQMYLGKKVIVRANVAGVHVGIVTAIDDTRVVLKDARRLWRWYATEKSGSLSHIAAHGLPKANHQIGAVIPSVLIVNPPGLEVAEMTDKAYKDVMEYQQ